MDQSYPIVFYVSGHGFGHSARIIEVIRALSERRPDTTIAVRTIAPRRLFERALGSRVELFDLQCDTGMIQIDSLNIDIAGSIRQANIFHERLPQKAVSEAAFLRAARTRLVVADIPPLGVAAADAAGLPSILIGNFTWDWIYRGYPEESPYELTRVLRDTYAKATRALRLPISAGFEGLESVSRDIPFVARRSRREPPDTRRALGLPPVGPPHKPLVLMSFGGYGLERLNTAALARLEDYIIVTTDLHRDTIKPAPGLWYLSEQRMYDNGCRYEDLVRAADVVVTKPGYGIISESIANETAVLYTSRGRFVEYDLLVREMPRYVRSEFIDRRDLLEGRWQPALERLLASPPPPERPALNGAAVAAEEILELQNRT
jgi:L-arabinokinase